MRRFVAGAIAGAVLVGGLAAASINTTSKKVIVRPDILYREIEGEPLYLDVYRPKGDGPFPAVVAFFDGGFRAGTRGEWGGIGVDLAQEGFIAFVVDYRLAPLGGESHFPDPVEDALAAVTWVRENGRNYDARVRRIAVMGASSGANLSLMAGLTGDVEAIVSWSGITDLPRLAEVKSDTNAVTNYIGCEYSDCPDTWEQASPINYVSSDDPPVFLGHAIDDAQVPVEQAHLLADALESVGVTYQLVTREGRMHAKPLGEEVWAETIAFLETYL